MNKEGEMLPGVVVTLTEEFTVQFSIQTLILRLGYLCLQKGVCNLSATVSVLETCKVALHA